WHDLQKKAKAVKSFAWAGAVAPADKSHARCVMMVLDEWQESQLARFPPMIPKLTIQFPPHTFANMPRSIERRMILLEVVEDLLNDKTLDEALRRPCVNGWPPGAPRHVVTDYPAQQLWRF